MRNADLFFGIVLFGALVWGLEQVAFAPLETGDVYPPYSSLRSDPLGAKALYESLAALPGITVDRLYKERTALEDPHTVLFVLGVDPVGWSTINEKTLAEYEKLVGAGGRLVIGFLPVRPPLQFPERRPVQDRWNVALKYSAGDSADDSAIPKETALYLEAGPEWRRIGVHNAVERSFGSGTIVLVADTFPLSDEGLREARDAWFIADLVGPATRVLFDENHFGVVETGSVAKLIRKYRLKGAVAMLALIAALFIWRSAYSLLPPRAARSADAVSGRDSILGMAALLHRGVPEKDLLDTCFAEWSRSAPRDSAARVRVEEEIRRERDPVQAYRAAARALIQKTPSEKK